MNTSRSAITVRAGALRRLALGLLMGFSLLTAAAPRAAGAGDASVNLAPKLEQGKTWRFRYHVTSEMDFDIAGQEHAMSLMKEVVVRAKVVETTASGAQVEIVHEEVRFKSTGEMPGSFDSDKPAKDDADNVYAHILRPLVGAKITLDLDKDGTIQSVDGLGSIAPGDMMEAQLFQSLFGQDEFIRMYQPLFSIKPGDPEAERGESWSVKQSQASGLGIVESDLRLTLERADRRSAKIKIGGESSVAPGPGASGKASESSVTGSCVWDLDEGVLRELSTKSTTTFAPDSSHTGGAGVSGEAHATTELELLDSSGR